ncbi:MAG: hypothetical protein ABL931_01350 [Usitatibacteraceae bacterium]|jgi:hypothetical protein
MRRVKTGWVAQRADGQNWATDQGTADGVYVVGTAARAIFHLAGSVDAEAGPLFDIPTDPVLLRELATSLNELAAWKERGAWGKLHS